MRANSSGVSNPFFIFPVRKHSGYYMLLAQNQEKSFIYTYLEDYKKDPNNATPYLVITMFDELAFKKGKRPVKCRTRARQGRHYRRYQQKGG